MKKLNKSVRCANEHKTSNDRQAQDKIQGMTGVVPGGKGRHAVHTADGDGNHRVPNLNRNSDGDWNFNLGNFEKDWNDDNCLLCFCHLFDSLAIYWREFFLANSFSNRRAYGRSRQVKR